MDNPSSMYVQTCEMFMHCITKYKTKYQTDKTLLKLMYTFQDNINHNY